MHKSKLVLALLSAFGLLAFGCGGGGSSSGGCDGDSTKVIDECGSCVAPGSECKQDCAGTWGGTAITDECGACVADASQACAQDCQGTWGGPAVVDECGVCVASSSDVCGPVDTLSRWNGAEYIGSFGTTGRTATYGQVVTLTKAAAVHDFAFEMGGCTAKVTIRGHVYAWNGARATGATLFDSSAQTIPAGAGYQLVSIPTGDLSLTAGTYVFFVSTSEDWAGAPVAGCNFGTVHGAAAYPGIFVYENNDGNPALWTGLDWGHISSTNLAMRVDGLAE